MSFDPNIKVHTYAMPTCAWLRAFALTLGLSYPYCLASALLKADSRNRVNRRAWGMVALHTLTLLALAVTLGCILTLDAQSDELLVGLVLVCCVMWVVNALWIGVATMRALVLCKEIGWRAQWPHEHSPPERGRLLALFLLPPVLGALLAFPEARRHMTEIMAVLNYAEEHPPRPFMKD